MAVDVASFAAMALCPTTLNDRKQFSFKKKCQTLVSCSPNSSINLVSELRVRFPLSVYGFTSETLENKRANTTAYQSRE